MMRYGVSNKQIISNVLEHVYSICQHEITFTLYRCVRHLQTCLQSIPVFPVYGLQGHTVGAKCVFVSPLLSSV